MSSQCHRLLMIIDLSMIIEESGHEKSHEQKNHLHLPAMKVKATLGIQLVEDRARGVGPTRKVLSKENFRSSYGSQLMLLMMMMMVMMMMKMKMMKRMKCLKSQVTIKGHFFRNVRSTARLPAILRRNPSHQDKGPSAEAQHRGATGCDPHIREGSLGSQEYQILYSTFLPTYIPTYNTFTFTFIFTCTCTFTFTFTLHT